MSRNKRAQHRPPREHPAKENAQLRQENRSLKRQVARLKKQVEQGVSTIPEVVEVEPQAESGPRCPACGGADLREFATPSGKVIKTCAGCKTRLTDAA